MRDDDDDDDIANESEAQLETRLARYSRMNDAVDELKARHPEVHDHSLREIERESRHRRALETAASDRDTVIAKAEAKSIRLGAWTPIVLGLAALVVFGGIALFGNLASLITSAIAFGGFLVVLARLRPYLEQAGLVEKLPPGPDDPYRRDNA